MVVQIHDYAKSNTCTSLEDTKPCTASRLSCCCGAGVMVCMQVMSKRKIPPGSPSTALRQLARDCTEQLGVYTSSRKRVTRLGQWNKGLQLTPLR